MTTPSSAHPAGDMPPASHPEPEPMPEVYISTPEPAAPSPADLAIPDVLAAFTPDADPETVARALTLALERRGGRVDALAAIYTASVARWWLAWLAADRDAREATEKRRTATGRRPHWRQVEALKLRRGREWESLDAALSRLGAFVGLPGLQLAAPASPDAPGTPSASGPWGTRPEIAASVAAFKARIERLASRLGGSGNGALAGVTLEASESVKIYIPDNGRDAVALSPHPDEPVGYDVVTRTDDPEPDDDGRDEDADDEEEDEDT